MLLECRFAGQIIFPLCALIFCLFITCLIDVINLPEFELEFLG